MRALGLDAGLAVNPETPFEAYAEWLDQIDLVLLMTVHPGFGGQSFISEVVPKISRTRQEIDRRGLDVAIEVDGGIDVRTAPLAAAAGASCSWPEAPSSASPTRPRPPTPSATAADGGPSRGAEPTAGQGR